MTDPARRSVTTPSGRPSHLREAHAHLFQHGRDMGLLRLDGCRSRDECLDLLARALARAPAGGWIVGVGLRVDGWPDPTWPTAADLDRVTGSGPAEGQPCCLRSFDHHALVTNSAGLGAAGISDATPDPPAGRIVRDRSGRATGVLLEGAAGLVLRAIPEAPAEDRPRLVRSALRDLAGHGFTEIHDLLSEPWLGPILASLHDTGEFPARVLLYPRLEHLDAIAATRGAWERQGLRLGGAKVFADGTLNARTASMLSPYADPLPGLAHGQAMMTRDDLAAAMGRAWSHGVGLAVHAIGDAAVRATLDACESLSPSLRLPVSPSLPPLRIEHAEIIDEADVERFASLGVVCSVQPCHLLADIEALRRGLPHRLDRVLPLRDLIDSGCRPGELLWFGSDVPIVRPDPGDSIQAAVHRRRDGAGETDAVASRQKLTPAEAWGCFPSGDAPGGAPPARGAS